MKKILADTTITLKSIKYDKITHFVIMIVVTLLHNRQKFIPDSVKDINISFAFNKNSIFSISS